MGHIVFAHDEVAMGASMAKAASEAHESQILKLIPKSQAIRGSEAPQGFTPPQTPVIVRGQNLSRNLQWPPTHHQPS
jgi:hypothetical protein